jgi:hypothetical protein
MHCESNLPSANKHFSDVLKMLEAPAFYTMINIIRVFYYRVLNMSTNKIFIYASEQKIQYSISVFSYCIIFIYSSATVLLEINKN